MKNNILKIRGDRNYKDWMPVKEDIQKKGLLRRFKEWEIWWCSIGENVGVEINGKGDKFTRPVIIYHKFSKYGFMGIPLTTKDHTSLAPDWYVHFRFGDVKSKMYNASSEIVQRGVKPNIQCVGQKCTLGQNEDAHRRRMKMYTLVKKIPPLTGGVGGKIPNMVSL